MTQCKKEEFETLYVELFPKMVNFAARLCRNRDDAEDVTQEAFMKAYKAFETCDDTHRVDNWLMKIVYNTFLDRKRATNRRVQEFGESFAGVDLALENCADPQLTAEEMLLRGVISPELVSALRSLDPQSRALVQQIYFEKADQSDLSRQYGIQIGALRSKIHRITLKLRDELSHINATKFASA